MTIPHLFKGSKIITIADKIEFSVESSVEESCESCQNYFQYVIGENGAIEGLIKFRPQRVSEHNLKLVMTVAAKLPSKYVGDLNLSRGTQASIEDLQNGNPLHYKVRFPISNPLPKVNQIILNGSPLCYGEKESPSAQYISTITLTHKFWTTLTFDDVQYIDERINTRQFYNPQPAPTVRYTHPTTKKFQFYTTTPNYQPVQQIPEISQPQRSQASFECGTRNTSDKPAVMSLILQGMKASKGEFPWLVAHFHRMKGYTCGGSLVSQNIVVTASHCIWDKGESSPISEYDSTYYMGKHKLKEIEMESDNSGVQKFIVHPNWDPKSERYDADIGIAVLLKTIIFTNQIKPICIWTNGVGHNDLVNRNGVIAGWGLTIERKTSDVPHYVNIPVVDDNVCYRSNPIFSSISTNTTMCVGDRTGRAPCGGDSGSAFAVKHNSRYYLRGVVSAAIADPEDQKCSAEEYTLFTDASYFGDWINHNINQFDR